MFTAAVSKVAKLVAELMPAIIFAIRLYRSRSK